MTSVRRSGNLTFYVFLGAGFFVLVLLTLKIVFTQISFFGFDYGDLVSLRDKILGREEAEKVYSEIHFVGDVMLARHVERLIERNGEDYLFAKIDLKESDNSAVIGNFEASVPKVHKPTSDYKLNFSVRNDYLSLLRSSGFTHFSLANNHSYDYGKEGYHNTVVELKKNDLNAFGHPTQAAGSSTTFIEIDDKKVAIIGLHTLFVKPNVANLNEMFESINSQSDIQIVYVHWGNEYELIQDQAQRELAEVLVGLGADLIVGHHPHVVQGIEEINGVPVFYSLGNFIFDQYFSTDVREGLVLTVDIDDELIVNLKPVFSYSNSSQPEYMNKEQEVRFLNNLTMRSSGHLAKGIMQGQINVTKELASFQKTVIIAE